MDRVILHSDCNCFYASVECLYRPEIRKKPVAVGGEPKHRHGIILTKNQIAKKCGVKTGEPLWKAKQRCPDLVIVPPNYPLYRAIMSFSRLQSNANLRNTRTFHPRLQIRHSGCFGNSTPGIARSAVSAFPPPILRTITFRRRRISLPMNTSANA